MTESKQIQKKTRERVYLDGSLILLEEDMAQVDTAKLQLITAFVKLKGGEADQLYKDFTASLIKSGLFELEKSEEKECVQQILKSTLLTDLILKLLGSVNSKMASDVKTLVKTVVESGGSEKIDVSYNGLSTAIKRKENNYASDKKFHVVKFQHVGNGRLGIEVLYIHLAVASSKTRLFWSISEESSFKVSTKSSRFMLNDVVFDATKAKLQAKVGDVVDFDA